MRKLITYLIRYPVWPSVLMFGVFGFGLIMLSQMRYSFFPETTPDTINITIAYPGASPEEVEEGIILKIEESLEGLSGVDRISSVSRESSGTVTIEILESADIDKVLTDVKNTVDGIPSFPVDAEKPVIFEQKFRERSLSVVMYGEADLHNLKYIAEEFRDELQAEEGISLVTIEGLPGLELSIEVSEADMRRYGLTFSEISSAVAAANVNISGGKFDTRDEEILIRAWGRNYYARGLLDIPVRGNPDGTVIYLRDIAMVREQWEDTPNRRYYDGRTSLLLNFDQAAEEDILLIADIVYDAVDAFNENHGSVHALVVDDRTIPLRQRITLLVKNGLIGILLVMLALGFFLNIRMSFWVAVAIPFSFAGMFIVASIVGITINVISLFGMILVVGILVDDGIVVGENIFAHYERGKSPLRAAIDGSMEVAVPVFTSVTTTIIAFTSFFFISGMLGRFMWQMSLVVIASLAFSLVEAFLILPAHLAHSKGLRTGNNVSSIRKRIENVVGFLQNRLYAPTLRTALRYKWVTVIAPVAMIMVTVGLLRGGFIGVTFFPEIDSDRIPINLSLVSGSQEAQTDSVLMRIEAACRQVGEELKDERPDGRDVVVGITRTVGSNGFGESGSHTGSVTVQLLDGETRQMESYKITNRIREAVGPVTEAVKLAYSGGGRFGKAVSISLRGNEFSQLDKARALLVAELEQFSSLKDVTDTDVEGRRELDITLKPRAHALGLTLRDVVGQVRQGFYGDEVQRIQRGRDEIRVWVRYRPEDRAALGSLDQMRIRTTSGAEYPFSELAQYSIDRGTSIINHLERRREIKVEANQTDAEEDLPPILEAIEVDVLPRVLGQVYGVRASFEGQSREEAKMVGSMMIVFPLIILAMFTLVILVFRSYAQPLLIFSLIPIGVLGAIWGHGIHSLQVNVLSLIGIIALSGIIINDSIVFVDQINRNLRASQKVVDAVYNAGLSRLRPILLTTLTTSLGLAPLIMETSRQAQFLIPMALSVAYGLLFGTVILLIILPASFLVFNSIRLRFACLVSIQPVTSESVEPAVKELVNPLED